MRRILIYLLALSALIYISLYFIPGSDLPIPQKLKRPRKIITVTGVVKPNETMDSIFAAHKLDKKELAEIIRASRSEYNLGRLSVGDIYLFTLDRKNSIRNMRYGIDTVSYLNVRKNKNDFIAEKVSIPHETKTGTVAISIQDNLIVSMPSGHREYLKLALDLSEIYAWDIDFSSDIRNGDSAKLLVEEIWADEVFIGFGNVLAAEFVNDGKAYRAYRFEHDGYTDYYDSEGRALRKALLRTPLRFRHISSFFSRSRFHPVLRIYRPHLGIDYAAPAGTPVSSSGNGTVIFAGYGGQIGNVVKIRHANGFETNYGHLSKIARGIRTGSKVSQGDIIGYVGSTGLSTGPHLDYRVKQNGKFVNPLKIQSVREEPVPQALMAKFRETVSNFDSGLEAVTLPYVSVMDNIRGKS